MHRTRRLTLLAVLVVVVLTAAGCGSDDDPALSGAPEETTSGTTLTLVAEDIAFNTNMLAAPAGEEVSLEYDIRDEVPHNLHIITDSGEEPKTEVQAGPAMQTLTFTIDKPGSYTYICDVHPEQMKGTLQVS
jgi:plastocyanin